MREGGTDTNKGMLFPCGVLKMYPLFIHSSPEHKECLLTILHCAASDDLAGAHSPAGVLTKASRL